MTHVPVEVHKDHLLVRLEGMGFLSTLRRSITVPYSTITRIEVGRPEWPDFFEGWRIGTHVPGLVARGTFVTWKGVRRFWWVGRSTKATITLHLAGHPDFRKMVLDVEDPEGLEKQVEQRRGRA